jgi:uncharacterized iron-regulated protein
MGSWLSALLGLLLASPAAAGWTLQTPKAILKTVAAPPIFQAAPVAAPTAVIVDSATAGVLNEAQLYSRLATADIVYVGERHDYAPHHRVQAAVLAGLHRQRPNLVVGLEMIPHTRQAELDDFLSGQMSEADFATFWNTIWGFDYKLYKPIFDYARAHNVPMRALNAPRDVITQIARGGLTSLTPQQRAQLPAVVAPIRDPRYLAYVREAFAGHGPMPPDVLARMFEAQAAWNETMAEQVLKVGQPVMVVAGSGHMLFSAGIAESVRNRRAASQRVVLPYPGDGQGGTLADLLRELRGPQAPDAADFYWLLPTP